jgi:hypothetical protein
MIAFFWFLVANDASFLTAAGRDSEPLPPDVRAVPFLPVPRVFSYQSSQWVLHWIFKILCRAAGVTHEKEIPEPFDTQSLADAKKRVKPPSNKIEDHFCHCAYLNFPHGLHVIMAQAKLPTFLSDYSSLLSLLSSIAANQRTASISPTRFVIHNNTPVVDVKLPDYKVKLVNQSMVDLFNPALVTTLKEAFRNGDSKNWLRWFPANRLNTFGLQAGLVEHAGDGLHFKGGCPNIALQLQLYFLNPDASFWFCRP